MLRSLRSRWPSLAQADSFVASQRLIVSFKSFGSKKQPVFLYVGRDHHHGLPSPVPRHGCFLLDNNVSLVSGKLGNTALFSTKSKVTNKTRNQSTFLEMLESDDSSESMDKAIQLWQDMISKQKKEEETEKPTNSLAAALLDQLLSSNDKDTQTIASQAQSIVADLENLYQDTNDPDFRPSLLCYHNLISAWSKSGNPQKAETVFWKLVDPELLEAAAARGKSKTSAIQTILEKSLNNVLSCWALSERPDSGKKCDVILAKVGGMESRIQINPNAETCQWVNKAWQNAVRVSAHQLGPQDFFHAAQRVQGNVDFMLMRASKGEATKKEWLPDPDVFRWLILAYVHAGSPEKAKAVLDRLINRHKTPNLELPAPTTVMYNYVLETLAHEGKGHEASLELSKWVSRCQIANEQRQNAISTESSSTEEPGWCQPDEESCRWVIHAWGKFADHTRAPEAEVILKRMLELQKESDPNLRVLPPPTVETFNAVLQAWSISRHYKLSKPVTQVERLWKDMKNLYGQNVVRLNPCAPNMRTYEIILETYVRFGYKLSDRKVRVNKVLREMKGHRRMEPSERCLELAALCEDDNAKTL